mgnify:CR=1 FL=1
MGILLVLPLVAGQVCISVLNTFVFVEVVEISCTRRTRSRMNIPESPILSYHFVPGHSTFINTPNKMRCKSFSPVACVPDVDDNLNCRNLINIFREYYDYEFHLLLIIE